MMQKKSGIKKEKIKTTYLRSHNFLVILGVLSLFACNKQKKEDNSLTPTAINTRDLITENPNTMYSLNIRETLTNQLKEGTFSKYGGIHSLYSLFEVEDTILTKSNFQKLAKNEMDKRIKNVFGVLPPQNNTFVSCICKCNDFSILMEDDRGNILDPLIDISSFYSHTSMIYISYQNNFITYAYYLPEILDYRTLYPEFSHLEIQPFYIEDELDGTLMEGTFWKNIPDLEQQQKFNQSFLIHMNKYIFNDSKASLTWLKNNASEFLEMLVIYYGYVKDEDLLKWILNKKCILEYNCDNIKSRLKDFGSVITYRKCDGRLEFHQEILDLIGDDKPEYLYINQISIFLNLLAKYHPDLDFTRNYTFENQLTFSERAEVYARLMHWGEAVIEKNWRETVPGQNYFYSNFGSHFMINFYSACEERDRYDAEFKRQNYYNLPKFKEYWENAKNAREEYENPAPPPRFEPEDEG